MRHHYSERTGKAEFCRAQNESSCPLGSFHGTKEEVSANIEETLKEEYGVLLSFKKKSSLIISEPLPEYEEESEREFWEGLRKNIGTFVHHGNEFAIQPNDEKSSTIYCITCNTVLSKEHEYFINKRQAKCDECGSKLSGVFDTGTLIARESLKFFNDDVIRESKWYHTTQNPNWEQSINDDSRGFLHIGTEQAANDRCKTLLNNDEEPTYLYEIEIMEDTEIHDKTHYEDPYYDNTPSNESDPEDYKKINFNGATRYVNEMEDPGSISLLINPKKIRIKNVKTVIPEPRE